VGEEGAQRQSRHLATRCPGGRGRRAAPVSRPRNPVPRWSRKARSACLETSQPGAGTGPVPAPGSPRLVMVAARPPRRPTGSRWASLSRRLVPWAGHAHLPGPHLRVPDERCLRPRFAVTTLGCAAAWRFS